MVFSLPAAPHVLLSGLTTLGVGGPADFFAQVDEVPDLVAWVDHVRSQNLPLFLIGEGSNLLVSDQGFAGYVLRLGMRATFVVAESADRVDVRVEAGRNWDDFVGYTVAQGWAGLECLSGIPGLVGAAPIQNIGAYGQEVADIILSVEVLDRADSKLQTLSAEQCGFGYRQSHFKGAWKDRFVVTAVTFGLRPGGLCTPRYRDLVSRLGDAPCPLSRVRETVLAVRREKSMVRDPADPNYHSAGSFFMNPVVPKAYLDAQPEMPHYPAGPEQAKLSAAWLIENSGFPKGFADGAAGLSSNHVLALINRGGAGSADLLRLARAVRKGVLARFGVELWPEPELVGFSQTLAELMQG